MSSRRQANQLVPGDRLRVPLTVAFEVTDAVQERDGVVEIPVKPVPCSEECADTCECQYSLFAGAEGPFPLRVGATQRVTFLGNLSQLLAESQRIQQQIAQLKASQNGDVTNNAAEKTPTGSHRTPETNDPRTYGQ